VQPNATTGSFGLAQPHLYMSRVTKRHWSPLRTLPTRFP
jgi:hypothetical protein